MIRNCTLCEHCHLDQGSPGYSEYTPGWDGSLTCMKGFWNIDFMMDDTSTFRHKMQMAWTCAKFKEVKLKAQWKSGDR